MGEKVDIEFGLYVTATPIGNLEDISARALQVLRAVDAIVCEDTRVTGKLLSRFGIKKPLIVYHDHNALKAGPGILKKLETGESVALVSDAGTPLISDPGFSLVKEARSRGIPVIPIPGPSALVTALMAAGLPTDKFLFLGFPPAKAEQQRAVFEKYRNLDATLIFYESPNRVARTAALMAQVFGAGAEAAMCRELTKMHEEILTLPLGALAENLGKRESIKGEIVLMVSPPGAEAPGERETDKALEAALRLLSVKDAAALIAELTGKPRKALYQRALDLKGK